MLAIGIWFSAAQHAHSQEMQPRAYLPSPVGVGFAGFGYSHSKGGLLFDPSLPIEDSSVTAHTPTLSVGGVFSTLGRTTQVLAILPYSKADISGKVAGTENQIYRSGLPDLTLRYAVNLRGAPAMKRADLAKARRRAIVGVSLTATVPASQYDPNRYLNIGTNRWAFKPEIGLSKAVGKWEFEGSFGAWLYTRNSHYVGNTVRTQSPLWSAQGHVVRVFNRRQWLAYDFTYFVGGTAHVNGQPVASYLSNTRMGGTYGLVLTPRQSIRFVCFTGVTTRVGTDITTLGVAYQFLWATGR